MSSRIQLEIIEHLLRAGGAALSSADVKPELSIRKDLGLDSLSAVELVLDLEERFNVTIAEKELVALQTVGDVFRLIEAKLPGTTEVECKNE